MGNRERDAEALVGEWCPALPGVEHLSHILPRPRHRADRYVPNRVHAKGEGGSDPEVSAASAAQRPEEIGVLTLTGAQHIAIGVDQLDGEEVVAREPILAREKADAAAESQAGDTDARAGPGGDGHAMVPQAAVAIHQTHPGADDRLPARYIDDDLIQAADVDHQTAIDDRERFVAMPPGASTEGDFLLARPADRVPHVVRVVADDNDRWKT
jgi:hypothetical protein